MIFGGLAPKFQVSSTDILLDFAVIEKDEPDYKNVMHESELDRTRNFITRPAHHVFEVVVHLHKYADPKAKYDEIMAQLTVQTCKVWRHRDYQPFQTPAGADALFVLIEAQPFYITTSDYADGLRLKFISVDTIAISDADDNWTFARALTSGASNAWYIDPTSGLLVEAADTTTSRRLVAGKNKGTAILIEGARTNINDRPSDFDPATATWVANNMTVAANTSETLDPAGGSNADKLTATSANGSITFTTTTAANDTGYGVWLKSASGSIDVDLDIDDNPSTITITLPISVTPEWTFFTHTNGIANLTNDLVYRIKVKTNTEFVYAWGCQFEVGSDVFFSSQIIDPVATASKTRAAESIKRSTTGLIGQNKGTIGFLIKPQWVFDKHPIVALLHINSTVASNNFISYLILANGNHELRQYNVLNAVASSIGGSASGHFTQNTWTHVVFTYDSTIANGLNLYINGVLSSGSPSSNVAFAAADVQSLLAIGSLTTDSLQAYAEFDEFFTDKTLNLGNEVLTASQILEIFNNGLDRSLI